MRSNGTPSLPPRGPARASSTFRAPHGLETMWTAPARVCLVSPRRDFALEQPQLQARKVAVFGGSRPPPRPRKRELPRASLCSSPARDRRAHCARPSHKACALGLAATLERHVRSGGTGGTLAARARPSASRAARSAARARARDRRATAPRACARSGEHLGASSCACGASASGANRRAAARRACVRACDEAGPLAQDRYARALPRSEREHHPVTSASSAQPTQQHPPLSRELRHSPALARGRAASAAAIRSAPRPGRALRRPACAAARARDYHSAGDDAGSERRRRLQRRRAARRSETRTSAGGRGIARSLQQRSGKPMA